MANTLEIFETPRFQRQFRAFNRPLKSRISYAIDKLTSRPWTGLMVKKVGDRWSCRATLSIRILFQWLPKSNRITLLTVRQRENFYRGIQYLSVDLLTGIEYEEDDDIVTMEETMSFNLRESVDSAAVRGMVDSINEIEPEVSNITPQLVEILPHVLAGGTEGKAKPLDGPGAPDATDINVIPSDSEGPCRHLLLAFCFDNDNFDDRMRETAYHAGIHCPDTKAVAIVTSQWDPKKWSKHVDAFERLNATVFVYLAGFGGLTRIG